MEPLASHCVGGQPAISFPPVLGGPVFMARGAAGVDLAATTDINMVKRYLKRCFQDEFITNRSFWNCTACNWKREVPLDKPLLGQGLLQNHQSSSVCWQPVKKKDPRPPPPPALSIYLHSFPVLTWVTAAKGRQSDDTSPQHLRMFLASEMGLLLQGNNAEASHGDLDTL